MPAFQYQYHKTHNEHLKSIDIVFGINIDLGTYLHDYWLSLKHISQRDIIEQLAYMFVILPER